MELLYVWVESYGNIKRQGFNFSPNYWFEVDENNNLLDKTEERKKEGKLKEQPENFFGENISNITAIVGKNGSGKSTVLELLSEILISKVFKIKYNFICVVKCGNEVCSFPWKKGNRNYNEYLERCLKFNSSFIKYTNIFDEKQSNPEKIQIKEDKNRIKFIDISTTKLLKDSIELSQKKNEINYFDNYANIEIEKEIKVLKEKKIRKMFNIDKFELKSKVKNYKYIDDMPNIDESQKSLLKNDILLNTFYIGSLRKRYNETNIELLFKSIDVFLKQYKNMNIKIEKIENIKVELFKEFNNEKEYVKKLENFFKLIVEKLEKNEKSFLLEIEDFFEYAEKSKVNIKDMINIFEFRYAKELYQYLSSGEKGLLRIFSRLSDVLKTETNENIILLMDEPDLTLHPEWQRIILKLIIDFLNDNFKDKYFQIILTSHSPFVASDLPRETVIMLDTDKEGNCIVRNDKDIKTFGANIFDLYSNAFFVQSSFGEFAKEKIKEVVEWLEYTENEKTKKRTYINEYKINKEQIEYILNSIGEPLVKNKLQKMYDEYKEFKIKKLSDDEKNKKILEAIKNSGLNEEEFKKYFGDKND